MTSSPKGPRKAARDDLPPALSSMWRLCKLGYRHEPGMLLAAFFLALLAALPDALLALWLMLLGEGLLNGRPDLDRAAQERGAPFSRLARHLFTTATTAPPGKEVRVTGIGPRLVAERRQAWERWYGPVAKARWGSAVWHTLAWALFGAAYVG